MRDRRSFRSSTDSPGSTSGSCASNSAIFRRVSAATGRRSASLAASSASRPSAKGSGTTASAPQASASKKSIGLSMECLQYHQKSK